MTGPRSSNALVLNPQEWVQQDKIRQAASLSGWTLVNTTRKGETHKENYALLGAIIAIESHGDTLAQSPAPDNCVALVQFHLINKNGLERMYGDQIRNVLTTTGTQAPGEGKDYASWHADPRTSIVYGGFIFKESMNANPQHNLVLALQGYNSGNVAAHTASPPEGSAARLYPEAAAAYMRHQALTGATPEIREDNLRMLERMRSDAAKIGQSARFTDAHLSRYSHSIVPDSLYAGADPKVSARGSYFVGDVPASPYMQELLAGKRAASPIQVKDLPPVVAPAPAPPPPAPIVLKRHSDIQPVAETVAATKLLVDPKLLHGMKQVVQTHPDAKPLTVPNGLPKNAIIHHD